MFAEAIEDILRDRCTPAAVRAIEAGGSPAELWEALAGAGFLDLLVPAEAGGAGLALPELFPVLAHFGRYAVPLPVGQAIVARGLVGPGVELAPGLLTLAPARTAPSPNRCSPPTATICFCSTARRRSGSSRRCITRRPPR